MMFYTDCYTYA